MTEWQWQVIIALVKTVMIFVRQNEIYGEPVGILEEALKRDKEYGMRNF